MIRFVGLGIYKEISKRVIDELSESDLYIDNYTFLINDNDISRLESLLNKKIKILERSMLEEKAAEFVSMAKNRDLALLVGGEPMIATMHKIVYLEAMKQGIDVRIEHSSSIFTAAITRSGLDFYRFGQVCTIAAWTDKYKPISFYEKIKINLVNNMHSLILFDYDYKNGVSLRKSDFLDIVRNAEKEKKFGIFNDNKIVLMCDLGLKNERSLFKSLSELERLEVEYKMACAILPARLSDIEKELLEMLEYDGDNL